MRQAPGSLQEAETESSAPELTPDRAEPRSRVFLQNLRELFRNPNLLRYMSTLAFWPDVFVDRGLPWRRFAQSGAYHILALVFIWAGSRFLALQPHPAPATGVHARRRRLLHAFGVSASARYTPLELPLPRPHADPEYSAQPIISVPPEADNRSQTIVTPPNIKLQRDVAMPNIVSLFEKMPGNPQMPIRPAPVVPASEISRLAPRMERAVIAPPPAVDHRFCPPSLAISTSDTAQ